MTGLAGMISRRAILSTAGGFAAASALGAEASVMVVAPPTTAATRLGRISLVADNAAFVADALQRFAGSVGPRTPSQVAQAGVHAECFWIGDTLLEVSEPAAGGHEHGGHLIGLEMSSPEIVRDRSRAAGLRLFRDMTVRGHRLVQPDMGMPYSRLESSAPLEASVRTDNATSVAGLKIVTDHPTLKARQVAAVFGGFGNGRMVSFGARHVQFVSAQAGDKRRGLVEVTLAASGLASRSANIAGVDWRIIA